MRKTRPVQVAAGALMLTVPGSAVALAVKQPGAASAPEPSPLQIKLSPRHVAYGKKLSVTGTASPVAAHRRVELQLQPAGSTRWHTLTSTRIRGDGRFALHAPLRTSGQVRVVPSAASGSASPTLTTTAAGPASTMLAPSAPQRVTVAAVLRVPNQSVPALAGQRTDIRGKLLPAVAGRRVRLLAHTSHGWRTITTARTGPHGGFDLGLTGGSGAERLRVAFGGDRLNSGVATDAGRVAEYTPALASWYDDGGATACGFHAHYGVASKSLPCGTHVAFRYGGRAVTAIVDDRGPYVGGREWDLNQNTAGALGFGGVGTVYATY
jgi:hypothetical protein